jgi:hypothetical protein
MIAGGKMIGKTKWQEDTGKLPSHINEPVFVADPNHRRKTLMKQLLALAKQPTPTRFTMTKMDATRIEKNFSYMIRQLPKMEDDDHYFHAGQAVLNNHFDNHEYCGLWCLV